MQTVQTQHTHVTNRQGIEFAELARQADMKRKDVSDFLSNKRNVENLFIDMDPVRWERILKQSFGKVHIIKNLKVDYSRRFVEAANAAQGTKADNNKWEFINMQDRYDTNNQEVLTETAILFNLNDCEYNDLIHSLQWAMSHRLQLASPQLLFAIAEAFPSLNQELGYETMLLTETESGTSSPRSCNYDRTLCSVKWEGVKREVISDIYFNKKYNWFVFRK
jgi:hypothetical protein